MQTISHKVTSRLLNYLEHGDEIDRCYAAKTLGNLKAKDATQALLERIRDEDIDVCIDAITALGKIRESSAIPVLLESLEKDPDGDVKLAVTESLAHFQSKDSIDILLKLAADRPQEMTFDENDDWDNWWDLQEKAIVILGEMKIARAFPVLKTILEDDFSQDIEAIVLKAMARIGGDADEYLIRRLSEGTEKQQRRTATALGFSHSKKTLQALGRALVSHSADTREHVIYALGRRRASQYTRAILLSLRDPNHNVKRAALDVMQQLAVDSLPDQTLDFDQIAALLAEEDVTLQTAVLSFFQHQHQMTAVMDTLTEASQQLFRQCLSSTDDKVLAQAAQLAAVTQDPKYIKRLFNLAVSETHSAWVRKEAILALGHLLNATEESAQSQKTLLNLRQLIHHKEQPVRFAAMQALLTLSNDSDPSLQDPVSQANEVSDDILPPIAILLATLRGEQFDLRTAKEESNCASGQQPEESTCNQSPCNSAENSSCSDKQLETAAILEQFEDSPAYNDLAKDGTHLIPSQQDQPLGTAMSTLEAIAMDNVEMALSVIPETAEQQVHDMETGPFISEELPQELDEFVAIMRQNFTQGKKIVRRKIDTFSDARHICARLLAGNTRPQYDEIIVNTLSACLNDEDEQLRQEAAESLSQISLRNPLVTGLNNSFGKLVTLLDSKDLDMRIACIHAISHSGNRAALPHLLDYLSDQEYLVRLHAIGGLAYIINNKARLSKACQNELMILDKISNDQVIAALSGCLNDQNYSVSMAAIEALTELQETQAIEQFIDVALRDEGQSARRISRLLKKLDTDKSAEMLLTRLDNVSDSTCRRYVMEMLEVVVGPEEVQMEAA